MTAPHRPGTPPAFYRAGSGTPLVLLHGAAMTWRAWHRVLGQIEREHDVFAPTLPGHWGAQALPDGVRPSIRGLADALERQLDDVGIETAHLVGNSLGGWLALELARRGRARSVVGLSPAGAWTGRHLVPLFRWLTRFTDTPARVVAPHINGAVLLAADQRLGLLRLAFARSDAVDAAELTYLLQGLSHCTILPGLLKEVARRGPLKPGLDRAECPILIAWGEHDRIIAFERHGAPLLELVPVAEHIVLPGVGHVPMYDDPALVASTVLGVTRAADGR